MSGGTAQPDLQLLLGAACAPEAKSKKNIDSLIVVIFVLVPISVFMVRNSQERNINASVEE
jgi:hypothetical protein